MVQKTKRLSKQTNTFSLMILLLLAVVLGSLLSVILLYAHFQAVDQANKPTGVATDKGEPSTGSASQGSNQSTTSQPNNNSQPGDNKSSADGSSSTLLLAPSGDFVSAHHVNLTSALVSVCNTSPGALCEITFTDTASTTTKALSQQATDRGGSAYWNWTPQSIGLYAGTWQIKATATLGSQTSSTNDAINLEVSS